jgi:hypothetical protein
VCVCVCACVCVCVVMCVEAGVGCVCGNCGDFAVQGKRRVRVELTNPVVS